MRSSNSRPYSARRSCSSTSRTDRAPRWPTSSAWLPAQRRWRCIEHASISPPHWVKGNLPRRRPMSLEGRLREGLVRASTSIDVRTPDQVLGSVVGEARRRALTRRLGAAAIVLVVGLAALFVLPEALHVLRGGRHVLAGPQSVGTISTVAGTGRQGRAGDGGPAVEAEIVHPADLGFDAAGNLYILQYFPGWVRKVDPAGIITTVFAGEPGHTEIPTAESATGMAVRPDGTIYLALNEQNRVIRIAPSGDVSTVAGFGLAGFSGDRGPATEAKLRHIWDVADDDDGNVYISTDNRIRKVDTSGVIKTIAGTGLAGYSGDGGPADEALVDSPGGLAVGADGTVYFIDAGTRIRKIDENGIITTIAGNGTLGFSGDGGAAAEASVDSPEQLYVGRDGTIYVGDTNNRRIRKIDGNGIITTVAGSGRNAFSGDGAPAIEANLSRVAGVAVGPDGNLYIADFAHERVRMVAL